MNHSRPKSLIISLFISYVISGILLLAVSLALYKLKLPEAQINMAVYVVYAISCFLGGLICGKKIKYKRFLWGFLTGLLYFIILFILSWVMGPGTLPEFSHLMVVMGCCLAGGTAGGILS